ncbi:disulfide bond formation protein DsbA, partial [Pseudomonas aeruginosa]|nr:disulfide bond formation protein DsbA [Pseudomonas aeruginosa]
MRMLSFARRHPRIGLLIVVTIAVASWVLLRAPHPATESMSLVAA